MTTSAARPAPHTRAGRVATRWHVVRVRGRVVGIVRPWGERGELALVRAVHGDRHQLQNPPAWSVAIEVLEAARAAGTQRIVVVCQSEMLEWWSWLGDFDRHGFDVDYGHGRQRALGLQWWSRRPLRPHELETMLGRRAR